MEHGAGSRVVDEVPDAVIGELRIGVVRWNDSRLVDAMNAVGEHLALEDASRRLGSVNESERGHDCAPVPGRGLGFAPPPVAGTLAEKRRFARLVPDVRRGRPYALRRQDTRVDARTGRS